MTYIPYILLLSSILRIHHYVSVHICMFFFHFLENILRNRDSRASMYVWTCVSTKRTWKKKWKIVMFFDTKKSQTKDQKGFTKSHSFYWSSRFCFERCKEILAIFLILKKKKKKMKSSIAKFIFRRVRCCISLGNTSSIHCGLLSFESRFCLYPASFSRVFPVG